MSTARNEIQICPDCSGSGWRSKGDGVGVVRCKCWRESRARYLLGRARIPERFDPASFKNFRASSASLQHALEASRKLVNQWPEVESGLLYLGNPGCGKTHLAVALLKGLIEKSVGGLFYDFNDLLQKIRDSYSQDARTSELRVLQPVYDAEVLVLDELGASKPTEWVQETMTHIVNKRYNSKRLTILTSNYLDLAVEGSAYSETLVDRIGPRFRSRLREMCRLVLVEAPDYREKIRTRRGMTPASLRAV